MKLYERIVLSWRTSAIGVSGTAVGIYLFNALGCTWPTSDQWMVVILPAVIGILTKEKKT